MQPPTIERIELTSPLAPNPHPKGPAIPEKPGIALRFLPATRAGLGTTAVLGAVKLTDRQSNLYQMHSEQVLRLVAFDPALGQLWHRTTLRPHVAVIGPARAFNPARVDPPPGEKGPKGWAHQFTADFPAAVRLPPDAARYTCVAWLDELVSEPGVVLIEENKARFGSDPVAPEPASSTPVHIRALPNSPERADNSIVLKVAPSDGDGKIGRVLGSIGPGVLPKVAPGVAAAPKYLAVLLVSALTHQAAARVARLPGAVFDETGCGEFDFEAIDFFPDAQWRSDKPEPVFVVCIAGGVASKAVTLLPEGWKD
jgi:hypothetical protein